MFYSSMTPTAFELLSFGRQRDGGRFLHRALINAKAPQHVKREAPSSCKNPSCKKVPRRAKAPELRVLSSWDFENVDKIFYI
jgi:hypothetical protein